MSSPTVSIDPLLGGPSTKVEQATETETPGYELGVIHDDKHDNTHDEDDKEAGIHPYSTTPTGQNNSPPRPVVSTDMQLLVTDQRDNNNTNHEGPSGQWKDGTYDWITLYLCTACCTVISLSQVMTRMRLNWLAQPQQQQEQEHSSPGGRSGRRHRRRRHKQYSACQVVTAIVLGYWALRYLTWGSTLAAITEAIAADRQENDEDNHNSTTTMASALMGLMPIVSCTYCLWSIYINCRTREMVRARYQIPEESCRGTEDLLCACCCPFWSVIQMSRHTGDFHHQRAVFFNETGLEPKRPN